MELTRLFLGLLLATASLVTATSLEAQEPRTWTATTGHELKGTLVSFTEADVVIKDLAGKLKKVPRAKLSDYDRNYVMDFPQLENKATFVEGKLPSVRVDARRAGSGKFADITADITIRSRHTEDLEVEVLWIFYGEFPNKGGGVQTGADHFLPLEPRMTRVTVKAQDEVAINTLEARSTKLKNGKAWESSMKIHGFIVQVYTDGQLLGSHFSNGILSDISKDASLLAKHTGL